MHNIFENLDRDEINKLIKLIEGIALFYKENTRISIYNKNMIAVVLKGHIQITKTDYHGNKFKIYDISPGMIFGSTLYPVDDSEYDIFAMEDTKIVYFDYDIVMNTKNSSNYYIQFIKNLIRIMNTIIEDNNSRINIITKKTIRDKLLEYFELMSKKTGSNIINLPFTITDLANFLSVDRSAMSRELKNLKDEGFISVKGKKVILYYKEHFTYRIV